MENIIYNMFISGFRVLKLALQNTVRNIWLSLATITIFLLTLLTINAIILVSTLANNVVRSVEEKVEVTIYFTPETSVELAQSAQEYIQTLQQVRTATLKTAEDNLQQFKQTFGSDEAILSSLEEVGDNPFGPSVVIAAESSSDFPFIIEAIETPEFEPAIQDKDYVDNASVIETIETTSRNVRLGGVILAAFFALIASLIVFNTIRVAIYVHRDEIGIMKLVGATDTFVQAPFLIEAMLYSVLATAAAAGIVLALAFAAQSAPNLYVDASIPGFFINNAVSIFAAQAAGLTLLSVITTWFAMNRYLRV